MQMNIRDALFEMQFPGPSTTPIAETDRQNFRKEALEIIAKFGSNVDLIIDVGRRAALGFYIEYGVRLTDEKRDQLIIVFEKYLGLKSFPAYSAREDDGSFNYRFLTF